MTHLIEERFTPLEWTFVQAGECWWALTPEPEVSRCGEKADPESPNGWCGGHERVSWRVQTTANERRLP